MRLPLSRLYEMYSIENYMVGYIFGSLAASRNT
jgi:hypothetical protein